MISPQQTEIKTKIEDPNLYLERMNERANQATRYMESQGFETFSQHGQRISINTRFDLKQLEQVRWAEVFIGKLPRDMFEDQLFAHINYPAPVVQIRFMMDFSRTNRGFCFVKYPNTELAIKAINYLDGRTILPDRPPIGAKMSFDNRRLFFSDLPHWCSAQQLASALKQAEVDGIVSVRMSSNDHYHIDNSTSRNHNNRRRLPTNAMISSHPMMHMPMPMPRGGRQIKRSQNAFVEFNSHEAATRARRILLPGDVKLFERAIMLDWAKSEVPQAVADLLKTRPQDNSVRHADTTSTGAGAISNNPLLPTPPQYMRQRKQSGSNSTGSQSSLSISPPSEPIGVDDLLAPTQNMLLYDANSNNNRIPTNLSSNIYLNENLLALMRIEWNCKAIS